MQDAEPRADHDFEQPISNGPNARPREEPIGQTEGGFADDFGKPAEITPEQEAQIADRHLGK